MRQDSDLIGIASVELGDVVGGVARPPIAAAKRQGRIKKTVPKYIPDTSTMALPTWWPAFYNQ
jgi:hypothetical protein